MIKNAKRAAFFLLSLLLLLSLFACGEGKCDHRFAHIEKRDATCRTDGTEEYYLCLNCNRIFSDGEGKNEISSPTAIKTTHTQTYVPAVKETCNADGVSEYYECSCGKLYSDKMLSKEIKEPPTIKKGHIFDRDGKCARCDALKPCEHLVYAKSSDGASYRVIGYSACFDVRIVVPETYDGLPVTEISASAFSEARAAEEIILPSGIKTIGKSAFSGCASLKSLTVGRELLTVEERAFYGCSSLTEISLSGSLTTIGKEAFSGCSSLQEVRLGSSLKRMGEKAFYSCSSLERIGLPTTLSRIGSEAFGECDRLRAVYFVGVDGWCYYKGSSYRDFEGEISHRELSVPETAAELLTDEYCTYFWIRDIPIN